MHTCVFQGSGYAIVTSGDVYLLKGNLAHIERLVGYKRQSPAGAWSTMAKGNWMSPRSADRSQVDSYCALSHVEWHMQIGWRRRNLYSFFMLYVLQSPSRGAPSRKRVTKCHD